MIMFECHTQNTKIMTQEESQWLVSLKKRSARDFSLILIFSALCAGALIAYVLY